MSSATDFDQFAEDYDALLEQGLSSTGEGKDYFARGRVLWLRRCLERRRIRPRMVMDFGCGTGSAIPYLLELLGAESVVGADVSQKSLKVARAANGSERVAWILLGRDPEPEGIDLAFCNGDFHHIPPGERAAAVRYLFRALRPGGIFALWENNPWNPGTRYLMSRTPLDARAVPLAPPESRRMLAAQGFEVLQTDFLFIFPRVLAFLRRLEPPLCRLPLGGQYQVLALRP